MHRRHHNGTRKKRISKWVVASIMYWKEMLVVIYLVVVGPLLDGFINRIGKGFTNTLGRSKLTGIPPLANFYTICQISSRLWWCCYYSFKEYHYNFSKSRCNSKDMAPIKIFQVKMVSRRLLIMELDKLWLQEERQSL